jgi:hypothetical protein
VKRTSFSRINELDKANALVPRFQPSPSQENLQDQFSCVRFQERAEAPFHCLNHGLNGLLDYTEKIREIRVIRGNP